MNHFTDKQNIVIIQFDPTLYTYTFPITFLCIVHYENDSFCHLYFHINNNILNKENYIYILVYMTKQKGVAQFFKGRILQLCRFLWYAPARVNE